MTAIMEVRNLVKHFEVRGSKTRLVAVGGVSFEVNEGETLGVVGESGSGKTTVGRCLVGLIQPTSGQVAFRGLDLSKVSKAELQSFRSKTQIVFQEPYEAVNPRMRIKDILAEPLTAQRRLNRREIQHRINELVEQVLLEKRHLDLYPHEVSAGELQRVGVARALGTNPELLVLDEPTSTLDAPAKASIVELLKRLQRELRLSYVFISHDLSTVRDIGHRVAVMYLGEIVEIGPTEQIFEMPRHPYTKALLSALLPPDPFAAIPTYVLQGEIPSPVDLPSACYLASRCPEAQEQCRKYHPRLAPVSDGSEVRVRCLLVVPEARDEPESLGASGRHEKARWIARLGGILSKHRD